MMTFLAYSSNSNHVDALELFSHIIFLFYYNISTVIEFWKLLLNVHLTPNISVL